MQHYDSNKPELASVTDYKTEKTALISEQTEVEEETKLNLENLSYREKTGTFAGGDR